MKKIISIIIFAVFYIFSIYNFLYRVFVNYQYPTLNFIISLMVLLSFLVVTVVFSNSKKFLYIMSAFFIWLFIIIIALVFFEWDIDSSIYTSLLLIPFYAFALPLTRFFDGFGNLLNVLFPNRNDDYDAFIFFAIIVVLFYATYFISRKISQRHKKTIEQ